MQSNRPTRGNESLTEGAFVEFEVIWSSGKDDKRRERKKKSILDPHDLAYLASLGSTSLRFEAIRSLRSHPHPPPKREGSLANGWAAQMSNLNLSGTFNVFKLLFNPSLCLPHAAVSSFNQLPIPVTRAFGPGEKRTRVDIRAIVLDKDNCFAKAGKNSVHDEYKVGHLSPCAWLRAQAVC